MVDRATKEIIEAAESGERIFSVSVYLDLLNTGLKTFSAKIRGEVTKVTERGGHRYFSIKDDVDGSILNCIMWKSKYELYGINLSEGIEVILHGTPDIYKVRGEMKFIADSVELVGEGSLAKQYEELKVKLGALGLFAPGRKKLIPDFPVRIGLVTSRQGDAIHDFLNNIGRHGYQIFLYDARVEGQQAVPSILSAVSYFKKKDIDVLVLIRGGGSLESLQAFNNEKLVLELAKFDRPVVSGIGHEKDVSLVDLVADNSCSTPTAVARLLNYSWEQAGARTTLMEKEIFNSYRQSILETRHFLEKSSSVLQFRFSDFFNIFKSYQYELKNYLGLIHQTIFRELDGLQKKSKNLVKFFRQYCVMTKERLSVFEQNLNFNDPKRQLALGYSLVFRAGRVLRSTRGVRQGEQIDIQLQDGNIISEVKSIKYGKN